MYESQHEKLHLSTDTLISLRTRYSKITYGPSGGVGATLSRRGPSSGDMDLKGDAMNAAAADFLPVDETSETGHLRDLDNETRGAALAARREAAGITAVELEKETGIARQTIARAEKGQASKATYRQLEAWYDRFDEETGANAPSNGIIEFTVEGDFGVRVVVKGPIRDAEAIEQSVARIVRNIRTREGGDES